MERIKKPQDENIMSASAIRRAAINIRGATQTPKARYAQAE